MTIIFHNVYIIFFPTTCHISCCKKKCFWYYRTCQHTSWKGHILRHVLVGPKLLFSSSARLMKWRLLSKLHLNFPQVVVKCVKDLVSLYLAAYIVIFLAVKSIWSLKKYTGAISKSLYILQPNSKVDFPQFCKWNDVGSKRTSLDRELYQLLRWHTQKILERLSLTLSFWPQCFWWDDSHFAQNQK